MYRFAAASENETIVYGSAIPAGYTDEKEKIQNLTLTRIGHPSP